MYSTATGQVSNRLLVCILSPTVIARSLIIGTNSVTFPINDWVYYVRVKAWADAVVLLLQLLVAASSPPARKPADMEKDDVESYGYVFLNRLLFDSRYLNS